MHNLTDEREGGEDGETKALSNSPEYHMDLPLDRIINDILDIQMYCKSMGFHPHLFTYIIVISLSKYDEIEQQFEYGCAKLIAATIMMCG